MNNKTNIEYKGTSYELIFNLNVMELIQEEYGSVEAWGTLTDNAAEPNAKAVKFGITAMLNEGIDIYNDDNVGKADYIERKPFTLNQVGRLITEIGLNNIAEKLNKTVVDSTASDEKN